MDAVALYVNPFKQIGRRQPVPPGKGLERLAGLGQVRILNNGLRGRLRRSPILSPHLLQSGGMRCRAKDEVKENAEIVSRLLPRREAPDAHPNRIPLSECLYTS
jgi:hypothetical protein